MAIFSVSEFMFTGTRLIRVNSNLIFISNIVIEYKIDKIYYLNDDKYKGFIILSKTINKYTFRVIHMCMQRMFIQTRFFSLNFLSQFHNMEPYSRTCTAPVNIAVVKYCK